MAPMGFLSWLGLRTPAPMAVESPWANPDVLTRIMVDNLWPGLDWQPMTRAQAMAVPAVAAARHRIVGTLSRLPLTATGADGSPWDRAIGLLRQPDDTQPHTATMAWTLDDLLFYGHAWWLVVKAYSAPDAGTRPLPLSVVHVPVGCIDSDGDIDRGFLDYLAGRDITPLSAPNKASRPWLLYFPGPHEGLLAFGCHAIRAAADLERAAGHAADNPVPSVELHQVSGAPMTDQEIDKLTARWADARRGRNGGVAYTNAAIEAKMHGAANGQLLVDARNQSAVDIARLAGIPASAIDAAIPGTALTYANLIDRVHDLINFGLSPYASAVTARLSMDDVIPHGVTVTFDYSTLYPAQTANAPAGATTTQRENQP